MTFESLPTLKYTMFTERKDHDLDHTIQILLSSILFVEETISADGYFPPVSFMT